MSEKQEKIKREELRRSFVYSEIQKCIEACAGRLKDIDFLSVICAYKERNNEADKSHLVECGEYTYRVTFERGKTDEKGNFIKGIII